MTRRFTRSGSATALATILSLAASPLSALAQETPATQGAPAPDGTIIVPAPDGDAAGPKPDTEQSQPTADGEPEADDTKDAVDDDGEPSNVAGSRLFAYAGIVTINVDNSAGPIVPGDLLITSRSNPGHAMLGGTDPAAGTVIAKALESYSAAGTGQIRALVMLR